MKKTIPFLMVLLVLTMLSCRQRKDAGYYERMVDSIRKAEQVRQIQHKAGIQSDPVSAFLDTLTRRPLPIRPSGSNYMRLGGFVRVPPYVTEWLGYPPESQLRALRLPRSGKYDVLMLAEVQDTLSPVLWLCTLDARHCPVDELCIYEEVDEERLDDYGKTYVEYFVTSHYEVTLMYYYLKHGSETPRLDESRRYIISTDGRFEETIIEL